MQRKWERGNANTSLYKSPDCDAEMIYILTDLENMGSTENSF